jgi:Fe-S-cluster-containing dehydrogenase component/DMSO reductase anchor subunit
MRNGFIFNHNKCVNCNACSAACIIENGWTVHPRNIFIYNSETEFVLPVINLSLACNHCESAVCLTGCPADAFSREAGTGAIVVDEKKCIGCRYCQWNCPYDAPKFDEKKNIIAKCNLCYSGLIVSRKPACSNACPTGALKFGELSGNTPNGVYSWFPDKGLNPAIEFSGPKNNSPLKVIPESGSKMDKLNKNRIQNKKEKNFSGEVSLIIFTFLATVSVSVLVSSLLRGVFPDNWIFIPLLACTGLVSFFHLGRKLRSWRSLANLRSSPLSREIAALIIYSVVSVFTVFMYLPALLIASSISGLILLLLIDSVYIYTDRSRSVILHSGQTFISALLIISFISGSILPFVFTALIKLGLSCYNLIVKRLNNSDFTLRYLRIAFLVVPGLNLILHNSRSDIFIIIIFLFGELIDRILFYKDFNPININTLINRQFKKERDEKKRY